MPHLGYATDIATVYILYTAILYAIIVYTYYCGNEERDDGNSNDWGDNVDEPVRQEWRDPQEYDVIDEVIFVLVYLIRK